MRAFLTHLWTKLRTSFWFVPGAIVAISIASAYGAIALDRVFEGNLKSSFSTLREVSAEGVRNLLSTAATSVLTLAGITFSATIVALTLASNQFGGRLLRNFIRSLPNQISLGVPLGNFVFCLIVLRSVQGVEDAEFIPHVAALVAFTMTLASLATFILFVHHIAVSLQADNIVASVYKELKCHLDHHFPDKRAKESDERNAKEEKESWEKIEDESSISAPHSGFVQVIDVKGIVELARQHELRCRLLCRPGHFVRTGEPIVAFSGEADAGDSFKESVRQNVIIGPIRTSEQDFEFCLRQLVEIALRALSPGINDPFTAIACVDYLGAALKTVAGRRLPARVFKDKDGNQRVFTRPVSFGDLMDAAFHQIRQTASDRVDILLRILEALEGIASATTTPSQLSSVKKHADTLASTIEKIECEEPDRSALDEALEKVRGTLPPARENDD